MATCDIAQRVIVVASHRRSGTHLTIDSLRLNTNVVNDTYLEINRLLPRHEKHISLEQFTSQIRTAPKPYTIIKTHRQRDGQLPPRFFEAIPENQQFLETHPDIHAFMNRLLHEAPVLYIYRDGRDVMVSLYHYITKYKPEYENCPFVDHLRELAPYWRQNVLSWLNQPGVVFASYESFAQDYDAALAHCLDRLGLRPSASIHRVYGAFHKQSRWQRTWQRLTRQRDIELTTVVPHKGIVGGWKQHFGPDEKAVFKELTGDVLLQLGYEQSSDW
jgi:hypothetical protein